MVTFAAHMLGVGGLAHATDKACFPMPTFVSGGDPDFTKLDQDNQTRWTGSSGYGWNSGGPSLISYEGAIGTQPPVSGHTEISGKRLLLSFTRQSTLPEIDSEEGIRVGFSYAGTDTHGNAATISEIIALKFQSGNHVSGFSTAPPPCTSTSTGLCANDPAGDPSLWKSVSPQKVDLLQKLNDGVANPWPLDPSLPVDWVKDQSRLWVFVETDASGTSVYSWRLQMALPIRKAGTPPDPSAPWSSPSVYLDPNLYDEDTTKPKGMPPFWVDLMTMVSGMPDHMTVHHYPDWDDTAMNAPSRDGTYQIPSTIGWGQAEMGSPRGTALLTPGDITCSGTGLTIGSSTADSVIWHSDIWNTDARLNTSNLFKEGGQLYMITPATATQPAAFAANRMPVQVTNTSSTSVDPTKVKAHFLIAPYGSQAGGTVWSPMTIHGNDFTCSSSDPHTCGPQPAGVTDLIDSQPTTTSNIDNTTPGVQINQATEWIPSANYACAVQENDAPMYNWYYENYSGSGGICQTAIYTPNVKDGSIPMAAGFPGHQCIQATLDSSGVGVQFATKSAFRNMHTVPASLHRETATIDTRGLKKIKNQSYHDIYLYVETHNMPYRVDAGYAPTTYNQAMATYNAFNYRCGGGVEIGYKNGDYVNERCPPGEWDANVPAPSQEFFYKTMPTMIVHAYADTGQTYKSNGRTLKLLTQLTSFGQYVTHDATTEGAVYGWDASLEPLASTGFHKVAPNTYRLRIPNDGAGQVVTRVEPLPTKRPTCSGTVDMNIVQLLQSIAPLIKISPECAGEINALVDSLQIECVDLQEILNKIVALDWGTWTSWVKFLVAQVEAASGCKCN